MQSSFQCPVLLTVHSLETFPGMSVTASQEDNSGDDTSSVSVSSLLQPPLSRGLSTDAQECNKADFPPVSATSSFLCDLGETLFNFPKSPFYYPLDSDNNSGYQT